MGWRVSDVGLQRFCVFVNFWPSFVITMYLCIVMLVFFCVDQGFRVSVFVLVNFLAAK